MCIIYQEGRRGSFQAKAFRVHDGQLQAVGHGLLGGVRGQQQGVEARVGCWQLLRVRAVALQDTPAQGTLTFTLTSILTFTLTSILTLTLIFTLRLAGCVAEAHAGATCTPGPDSVTSGPVYS